MHACSLNISYRVEIKTLYWEALQTTVALQFIILVYKIHGILWQMGIYYDKLLRLITNSLQYVCFDKLLDKII